MTWPVLCFQLLQFFCCSQSRHKLLNFFELKLNTHSKQAFSPCRGHTSSSIVVKIYDWIHFDSGFCISWNPKRIFMENGRFHYAHLQKSITTYQIGFCIDFKDF